MEDDKLIDLWRRAGKYGTKISRSRDLGDEFASWYVIQLLQGYSKHQPMKYAFIDFKRSHYGMGSQSKMREVPLLKLPETADTTEPINAVKKLVTADLTKHEIKVFKAYLKSGSAVSAAKKMKVTGSWVSRVMKAVRKKITTTLLS